MTYTFESFSLISFFQHISVLLHNWSNTKRKLHLKNVAFFGFIFFDESLPFAIDSAFVMLF